MEIRRILVRKFKGNTPGVDWRIILKLTLVWARVWTGLNSVRIEFKRELLRTLRFSYKLGYVVYAQCNNSGVFTLLSPLDC
jgi:hypothetical protein